MFRALSLADAALSPPRNKKFVGIVSTLLETQVRTERWVQRGKKTLLCATAWELWLLRSVLFIYNETQWHHDILTFALVPYSFLHFKLNASKIDFQPYFLNFEGFQFNSCTYLKLRTKARLLKDQISFVWVLMLSLCNIIKSRTLKFCH